MEKQHRTTQVFDRTVKITKWLSEHQISIVKRSDMDLAQWCERELHFPVTAPNIRRILNGLGIKRGAEIDKVVMAMELAGLNVHRSSPNDTLPAPAVVTMATK